MHKTHQWGRSKNLSSSVEASRRYSPSYAPPTSLESWLWRNFGISDKVRWREVWIRVSSIRNYFHVELWLSSYISHSPWNLKQMIRSYYDWNTKKVKFDMLQWQLQVCNKLIRRLTIYACALLVMHAPDQNYLQLTNFLSSVCKKIIKIGKGAYTCIYFSEANIRKV